MNNGTQGIEIQNSSPAITGTSITGNKNYGIYVTGAALPAAITGNTLSGNISGSIGLAADSSGTVIAADNTFTDPVRVAGGGISRATTWSNSQVYYLLSPIGIAAGKELTLAAGTVVKFAQGAYLDINGTLNANGTALAPVYFTDYRDDTVGGDSNGDGAATSPAPGWWLGLNILDGGSGTLTYATVRYATGTNPGGYSPRQYGSVYKTGSGNLALTNCTVSNAQGVGIFLLNGTGSTSVNGCTVMNNGIRGIEIQNSSPTITRSLITGNPVGIYATNSANPTIGGSQENANEIYANSSFGVVNTTAAITVNARYNWWGSPTGPYHAVSNPQGTGNAVSDYVDFGSFLPYSNTLYNLTIRITGTGRGAVLIPSHALTCNTECTVQVNKGENLTITAQPVSDAVFSGWSGGICSGTGNCVTTVAGDAALTATFTGMAPTAEFSGAPLSGEEPLVVSFTDLSGYSPLSWHWSFGDGAQSTLRNPSHAYLDAGTYAVGLTATNSNGSDGTAKPGYVTVSACPNGPASLLPDFYPTLQEAYDKAPDHGDIRARFKVLTGTLLLNQNKSVHLSGGYDCPHQTTLGVTILNGQLKIISGTAVMANIAVR